MRVKEQQVFNLMDTNGRRNDVINALQGYLSILNDILRNQKMIWRPLPESRAQLDFYSQAIALSPDVFQKHGKYDKLMEQLDDMPKLKQAIDKNDIDWLKDNYEAFPSWRGELDKSVEARSRHYTSNLVKLGFADSSRQITNVGDVLLDNIPIHKDVFEELLPLNNTNIIYLRQLLKLRIFDDNNEKYYSPFNMALYALLIKPRISQDKFCEMIQGLSPYHNISDYDSFIKNYNKDDIIHRYAFSVPTEIDNDNFISEDVFSKHFTNKKSKEASKIYYNFYKALYSFINEHSDSTLNDLLIVYEANKPMLNKAFGYGSNIFKNKRGNRPSVSDFLKKEKLDLFNGSLNSMLYLRFARSKKIDVIREYSDTTMRIFKATGLISFDNGYVELVCRDLCNCIFNKEVVKSRIFGEITEEAIDNISDYEEATDSYYCSNHSVISILGYSETIVNQMLLTVQSEFDGAEISDIPQIVKLRRRNEFEQFVDRNYPETRVKALLGMFSDRSNDGKIKEEVCPDATVPTIYEYVVGLAWYYFSNKTIDLLNSFNLTLSANFEPLTHAGGGMGDIVIYEENQVIMLEATLMNANSQKRGEWEPVLRHSVNLKIEEETLANREVTTFFIADSFDFNTINIWKAISSVPLQSSTDKSKYTDSVIIMPINNSELSLLMERKHEYHSIIQQIRKLFLKDITDFDKDWREKFMSTVIV
jgi:hypothetical protein